MTRRFHRGNSRNRAGRTSPSRGGLGFRDGRLGHVRELALALPEAEESGEDRVAFRVRGKLFAWAARERDGGGLGIRVERDEKALILDSNPDVYFTSPHYDGWPGVQIRLEAIDREELASASRKRGSSRRRSGSRRLHRARPTDGRLGDGSRDRRRRFPAPRSRRRTVSRRSRSAGSSSRGSAPTDTLMARSRFGSIRTRKSSRSPGAPRFSSRQRTTRGIRFSSIDSRRSESAELEERIEESWLLRAPKRMADAYLAERS